MQLNYDAWIQTHNSEISFGSQLLQIPYLTMDFPCVYVTVFLTTNEFQLITIVENVVLFVTLGHLKYKVIMVDIICFKKS